jgi:hypothetical protein
VRDENVVRRETERITPKRPDRSIEQRPVVDKKKNAAECPHCGGEINAASLLRSIKSEARSEASRENGKKGGRPPSTNKVTRKKSPRKTP